MQKVKVLWICHFSNENVRSRLNFSTNKIENFLRNLFNKPKSKYSDFANWISSGIVEFEKFKDDVELHVVAPHYGMQQKTENFVINGIYYWFFKPDDDAILKKGVKYFTQSVVSNYKRNRKIIRNIIGSLHPDIIHMYGAENPYYSISALDINIRKYPFLVSLQTLMTHPDFKSKTTVLSTSYDFRSDVEMQILRKALYVGSTVKIYRDFIWENINPNTIFTKTFLGITLDTAHSDQEKVFDFVYFAASINKAADLAIEAFALAHHKEPSITLNIVGGEPISFKKQLVSRINQLGISDSVIFSGKLPTQDDVYQQLAKSRFALLPLKIDTVSGTVREAMFAGLPVVTTFTHGTPALNEKRESVLISEIGDHEALANNMLKLLASAKFADNIRQNALLTAKERWNNSRNMAELVEAYRVIIAHLQHGTPIPKEIGAVNPAIEKT